MADYIILKAVEHSKLSAATKKKYPTEQSLFAAGWWLQKKYDGCMGIATIRCARDQCTMTSRTGENYDASTQHILDELHEAVHDFYGGMPWPSVVFIGEVWQPITEATFPTISGKFRRRAPSPELRFMVNDVVPVMMTTDQPYSERYSMARDILGDTDDAMRVNLAPYSEVSTSDPDLDVKAFALGQQGAGGYDGAILRDPSAHYTVGDAKLGQIVKVKPTMSLDLRCNGVIAGEGKHAGRLGAISVGYRGVTTAVGTGLTDEDREFMWKGATAPAGSLFKAHDPINKIVEIECLGITADGKLREPRFKGVRFDKLKADE